MGAHGQLTMFDVRRSSGRSTPVLWVNYEYRSFASSVREVAGSTWNDAVLPVTIANADTAKSYGIAASQSPKLESSSRVGLGHMSQRG